MQNFSESKFKPDRWELTEGEEEILKKQPDIRAGDGQYVLKVDDLDLLHRDGDTDGDTDIVKTMWEGMHSEEGN